MAERSEVPVDCIAFGSPRKVGGLDIDLDEVACHADGSARAASIRTSSRGPGNRLCEFLWNFQTETTEKNGTNLFEPLEDLAVLPFTLAANPSFKACGCPPFDLDTFKTVVYLWFSLFP